ncbi:outer membrane beta-barrel family protein [Mucilaginibacter auburnensis]|uniref:Outer membrane receptor protein involved in Fe transport n=1 Tax=Mucilaginibacter auburnensis TaxID=1457233 RepID=A0A2H9VRR3_9SPHI|nr:outer membrane beta-barrel family protein [Mucilaginibacter auburnensis]PJJ83501.1 outer membrane receptor protein involved in Fe transport [Mucilaginibacter auburnensis]
MKLLFTSIYTLLLTITCTVTALAQTSKITGTLNDGAAKPVEFATVSLLRAADSSIVKGALSNEKGNYAFDNVAKGSYVIKATSVGYNTGKSAAFTVDGTGAVTVQVITMAEAGKTLNTVNVNATKPLIERKVDRTVMNVENSVLAAGNTALEILERAPGVTIDKDDNISLRGKQGVTIMINDKLTYLSQAQLATLLRSTDGTTIASIEIITNPSAKYDAAGNSGIINIKLKKNKQKGTNGSLTAGYARGHANRDNMSLNLNHKNGPLNVFGTFSRGDNNRYRELLIDRVVANPDTPIFNQLTKMPTFNYYNNFNIGADLETSSKNTVGVVASGYSNGGRDINDNHTERRSGTGILRSYLNTSSLMNQRYKNLAFNLNDRFKIDTLGQELGADLDYSKFSNNNIAEYNTYYFTPDGKPDPAADKKPLLLRNQTPSSIEIYSGKVDYTKPLSKTWKLESGLKFSSVKTDNDLRAQKFNGTDFENDAGRTNRFIYTEQIAAAYTNISHQFKGGSIQVGLRAENTESDGNLLGVQQIKRSYLNFFPSLFINRSLGKKHDLGFTYSRRIDRPNYDDLNPFIYYLDPFTFNQGNAFLKPQYTNNFELNYTYNKTIDVSLGYSLTTDVITELILTKGNFTFQTNDNLRTQKSYNVNIFSPFQITKWWSGNINFNGFYLGFKSNSTTGNVDNGRVAFTAKTTQTFTVGKFKAELVGDYRSSLVYGIYYLFPRYAVDAGLSRSFANKKLNVKVALNDVFNTMRNDLNSNALGNNFSIRQKSDTRVFRVNVTYNFGSTTIKARQHRSGAEAEKGRVNSGN